ncbi:4a-hydroxytetrahydrobiopterin dehydratase [Vibrio sp. ZSDZ34]|jgi:4a-hydroxytetrahydrobiopterin dehydratase|uniref:Putative pterin-4-alpha-carbinolamine dehydratase n=1 Tax=Vibrio gelatinilyticus TaxID=2893468 RepID=A0A9X1WB98_9VIBR|nr:4a-hydroxytetrahydrobiopterin dehydratase [Vibrio gelatinilyticus]MCJ2377762.1 4a-hydroxytetrahydrobiopterin dehydratase [Vibrio gelatinilyticus]
MLNELRCEACASDAQALSNEECKPLLAELDNWTIIERGGIAQLEKVYLFKNYKQAWTFANQVSQIAEQQFHHPAILLEWGRVTVTWWSHSIKGLHNNDFICAAKCDTASADKSSL